MAQYDGSIRINTQINIKNAEAQLDALGANISKSAAKIADLRSKLDSLKTAQIPTQEYAEISAQIEKAQHALDGLLEKQERMQSEGKTRGTAWERINAQIAETRSEISYAKGELQALVDEGKAFTVGDPAQEEKLSQQLQTEEARLASMTQKRDLLNSKVQAAMEEEQRLASIKENATVTDQKLVDLLERRRQLLIQIKDLEKAGVTEGYAEYDKAIADLSDVQAQINGIRDMRDAAAQARQSYVGLGETVRQVGRTMARGLVDIPIAAVKAGVRGLVIGFQQLGGVVRNVAVNSFRMLGNAIRTSLSRVGSLVGNVVSKMKLLGNTAKKSFSTVNKSAKKTGGLMGTIASRFKGIALSLFLFNWITKAFNGAVKSIKDGFGNLYKDNERFKASVDDLRASVLTLKNAFAAAFRPLVDVAIPYIQMAADKMTELLNKVGQFTAAITGQTTYTKAIKQTADAFKDAKKAAEGYLSPLDEINKFSSKKDEDEDQTGVMFEEVPIEQKFKDMAQKVKDVFKDLFAPIKEAWDKEGDFVIDSWKYGLGEIKKLLQDIGRDFLNVWKQPETIKIFEDILHIIGDIGLAIGNLASRFREAWNENNTGLHILENIRDIIGVIIKNIRHAADATVEWTKKLDFSPILTKIMDWTASLVPVFDALSGIITDFYEMVLLPLGKWVLEKGLPELLQVFIDFNELVDWEKLRSNFDTLWNHLEPFAETIGEGLIIFIRRLSEALGNFINSPAFSDFLTKIEEWMDRVTPEDVANGFEKIAVAILALKAASVAIPAISTAFSALSSAGGVLKGILGALPAVFSALASAVSFLLSPVGLLTAAVAGLVAEFVHLYQTDEEVKASIDSLYSEHIKPFIDGVVEGVQNLKNKIVEFWDTYLKPALKEIEGNVKELLQDHIVPALEKVFDALNTLWKEALEPLIGWIIDTLLPVVLPIIEEIINTALELIGWLFDAIGGLADIVSDAVGLIVDLIRGDFSGAWEHAKNIVKTVWDGITGTISRAIDKIKGWINDLLSLFDKAKDKGSSVGSGSSGESYSARTYSMRSLSAPAVHPAIAKLSNIEIPKLATGAVLPANREFLALVGDQKHGTNVEALLDSIKQAAEEAVLNVFSRIGMSGGNMGGTPVNLTLQVALDGQVIGQKMVDWGKLQQMATGNNPYALGTT